MGYGYLGSYIAYGFTIHGEDLVNFKKQAFSQDDDNDEDYDDDKTLKEEKDKTPGLIYIETGVYHDPEFPNLFIKQFGTDSEEFEIRYFVYFQTCFRGGEFWEPDCIGEPQTNQVALTPVLSAQTFLKLEQECDQKEFEKFQTKYKLNKSTIGWSSLICFGQLIY